MAAIGFVRRPLSPSDLEGIDPGKPPESPLSAFSEEAAERAESPRLPVPLREFFQLDAEEMERRLASMSSAERNQAVRVIDSFALIARFAGEDVGTVCKVYSLNPERYFEEQLKVAEFNRSVEIQSGDGLSQKLKKWAEARGKIEVSVRADGDKLLFEESDFAKMREVNSFMCTPIVGRYERQPVPRFPQDLVETSPTILDYDGDEIRVVEGDGYALLYPNPDNPEELWQLTAKLVPYVLRGRKHPLWVHTRPEYIRPLLRHLDSLYEELEGLGRKMTENPSGETRAEYFEQLAHVYWLAANICRTFRGNAQYCLNLLYHEMKRRNLPPLIPKVGVMPDCVALSAPLEVFQRCFLDLFESQETIQRIFNSR